MASPRQRRHRQRCAERRYATRALRERYALTDRQIEVARLLAQRLSNAEIADALGLSTFTARNHTEAVLLKLGASTRARVGAILRGQA